MDYKEFKRIPKHIGVIPDGNRRWAVENKKEKKEGYQFGVRPGLELFDLMLDCGVQEITFYGFTKDNNKRPSDQTKSYTQACIDAVESMTQKDANILIIGNTQSSAFPQKLLKFTQNRISFGKGKINVNFLINYDWNWDLNFLKKQSNISSIKVQQKIASSKISKIDLIIRWGGRRRLSGFLPIQSVYSDFYVVDRYWPDFEKKDFYDAIEWYQDCDITLGG